ncbi:Carboxylic ester hydrolase [Mycena venus]|uniref:Carboxylic ester hydrolase n=1 Tax=Mycena venus TaxID=2733690 RepID=A0A8H7CKN4_9AGAR|nr:Carboxylic ester hydrolase [Mycena venus]
MFPFLIVTLPFLTGLTQGNLTKFLGVKFAEAGRFEIPRAPPELRGVQNAKAFGPACPQQATTPLPFPFVSGPYPSISEDCLTLDVYKPAAANSHSQLPVLVWIYGGGFQDGNTRDVNASPVVQRSIETGEPIIVVTPNYRMSAFGFLAGKEAAAAGTTNLGLRDQIFALEWESGSPYSLHSIADHQSTYDALVAANNCNRSKDTLNCLRQVPFESFMATVNHTLDIFSYRSLHLVWEPIFSWSNQNITTDAEFLDYVHSNYLPTTTKDQIAELGRLYPEDPTQGSPFDTGTANELTPEYKRLSSFQGDFAFIAPRRFLLEHASLTQDTWSWLNKRGKDATPLGAFHVSDAQIWFPTDTTNDTIGVDAMINFVNTLDPNKPAEHSNTKLSTSWPKWNTRSPAGSPSLLTFTDAGINTTAENFRVDAIEFLNNLLLEEAMGSNSATLIINGS